MAPGQGVKLGGEVGGFGGSDVLEDGSDVLEDPAATSASSVLAVGSCVHKSFLQTPIIERWDGIRWQAQASSRIPGGGSYGLSAVAPTSRSNAGSGGSLRDHLRPRSRRPREDCGTGRRPARQHGRTSHMAPRPAGNSLQPGAGTAREGQRCCPQPMFNSSQAPAPSSGQQPSASAAHETGPEQQPSASAALEGRQPPQRRPRVPPIFTTTSSRRSCAGL
jgi:hypothetical protein